MRRFTGASGHYILLPTTAANCELTLSVTSTHATTVRFRTSTSSGRMMVYAVRYDADNEFYIDLNASAAGQLRLVCWNGTAAPTFTSNGKADGEWHTATVRRNGSGWRFFVDGSEVGTEQTCDIPTQTHSTVSRAAGRYPTSALFHLTGDLDYVAYHNDLTVAQHADLHNGDKNVWNCGASCVGFVPMGPSGAIENEDLKTYFVPTVSGPVSHVGGTLPALAASSPDRPWAHGQSGVDFSNLRIPWIRTRELVEPGGVGDSDEQPHEIGNVYQASDGTYCLPYTGNAAATPNAVQVHLATSPDGVTWTKQGVMLAHATLGFYTEDPYVYKDGSTYYLVCENRGAVASATHEGLALFSSTDGTTWTLVNSDILANGGVGTFDSQDVSSPVFWKEGATWYLLYEGRSSGDNGKIGLATASSPSGPWTKDAGNPVFTGSGWSATSSVPDDLVKVGSTYYFLYHGDGAGGYKCGVLMASNPAGPWSDYDIAPNPITGTECNTLMLFGGISGLSMVGVNEASGATQGSILRYDAFGDADTTPPAVTAAVLAADGNSIAVTTDDPTDTLGPGSISGLVGGADDLNVTSVTGSGGAYTINLGQTYYNTDSITLNFGEGAFTDGTNLSAEVLGYDVDESGGPDAPGGGGGPSPRRCRIGLGIGLGL